MDKKWYPVIIIVLVAITSAMLIVAYVVYNGVADGNNYMMDMDNVKCIDINETYPYQICQITKYYANGSVMNATAYVQK